MRSKILRYSLRELLLVTGLVACFAGSISVWLSVARERDRLRQQLAELQVRAGLPSLEEITRPHGIWHLYDPSGIGGDWRIFLPKGQKGAFHFANAKLINAPMAPHDAFTLPSLTDRELFRVDGKGEAICFRINCVKSNGDVGILVLLELAEWESSSSRWCIKNRAVVELGPEFRFIGGPSCRPLPPQIRNNNASKFHSDRLDHVIPGATPSTLRLPVAATTYTGEEVTSAGTHSLIMSASVWLEFEALPSKETVADSQL